MGSMSGVGEGGVKGRTVGVKERVNPVLFSVGSMSAVSEGEGKGTVGAREGVERLGGLPTATKNRLESSYAKRAPPNRPSSRQTSMRPACLQHLETSLFPVRGTG